MKTVIIYESKKGLTKKIASNIAASYDDVVLTTTKHVPSLVNFDKIIIGTPIYVGKIHKKIRHFIDMNQSLLLQKDTSLFLVGMNIDNEEEAILLNFSAELRDKLIIHYVGGGYNFEKLNFLEKFIVKKIAGVTSSLEVIHEDKLALYIKK